MKTEKLLEFQTALISCITDPSALSELRAGATVWNSLSFIDPALLQMLSSFYQSKRLDKLAKVFPLTLSYLAPEMSVLVPEFMKRHPPLNADSYTHGCQFYGFMRRRWRTQPANPPFLPDLAYCELARIGVERQRESGGAAVLSNVKPPLGVVIRRRRGIRLYHCQYDIQPLFGPHDHGDNAIAQNPAYLALSRPLALPSGKILGIDRELFAMLKGLSNWNKVNIESEQTLVMLQQLEGLGLLEVQSCE